MVIWGSGNWGTSLWGVVNSMYYSIGSVEQYNALPSDVRLTIEGNFLTGTLLHNALASTTQTKPIVVSPLDRSLDVSMIQASYDGQPVTISYEYCGSCRESFSFGFGYNFKY